MAPSRIGESNEELGRDGLLIVGVWVSSISRREAYGVSLDTIDGSYYPNPRTLTGSYRIDNNL